MKIFLFIVQMLMICSIHHLFLYVGGMKDTGTYKDRERLKKKVAKLELGTQMLAILFVLTAYYASINDILSVAEVMLSLISGFCLTNCIQALRGQTIFAIIGWVLFPVFGIFYLFHAKDWVMLALVLMVIIYLWYKGWKILSKK